MFPVFRQQSHAVYAGDPCDGNHVRHVLEFNVVVGGMTNLKVFR
jgi:hypothetical protein